MIDAFLNFYELIFLIFSIDIDKYLIDNFVEMLLNLFSEISPPE